MTAYLLTNHLLNFIAPAAFVALGLVLLARFLGHFLRTNKAVAGGLIASVAIIFAVNLLVMTAGLVFFGTDAKIASYAAMLVAAAATQTVLWRVGSV